MKVIRRGSAALGSVVEDHPSRTEISHELKEGFDRSRNGLETMIHMGNGEVKRKDRHGITKDQVFASIEDPLLSFGEVIQTEETWALVCSFFANVCQAALDPPGIVLKADGKSSTTDLPLPNIV